MSKAPVLLALISGVVFLAAGCGSSSSSGSSAPSSSPSSSSTPSTSTGGAMATVSTATVKGLGTVLVDNKGRTLYLFLPDKHAKVTCTGACATVWPPLKLAAGQKATVGGQAKMSMLGSDSDPAGGRVVTYDGWPLYTYVADTAAGSAIGQASNLNGGYWYVLSPSGAIIHAKPS
jgi:predicted lipoprotein with Yx(FWY)xxD motif